MITEGSVCIWQNQVGEWTYLNGTETTVLKGLHFRNVVDFFNMGRGTHLVYTTDSIFPDCECGTCNLFAQPHELRLKDGPDELDEDIPETCMTVNLGGIP